MKRSTDPATFAGLTDRELLACALRAFNDLRNQRCDIPHEGEYIATDTYTLAAAISRRLTPGAKPAQGDMISRGCWPSDMGQ